MRASGAAELRRHPGDPSPLVVDQIVEVYADARADALFDGPLWTREAFRQRLGEHLATPGRVLVTAHAGATMVGIALGLPFAPGQWWTGQSTAPPAEILASARFVVVELDVRPRWRAQGIGRLLLDAVLRDRPERYAMLSTLPQAPARQLYRRWGWHQVAENRPPDGPPMHTLVLPLARPGPGADRLDPLT
jgi:GNAT superfamily N-acetyltransferase